MEPEKKTKIIVGVVIGCVVVAAIVFFFLHRSSPAQNNATETPQGSIVPAGTVPNVSFSQTMYQVALTRAQSWQSNAALANMTSADASGQTWDLFFVSPSAKGKALDVTMSGQNVVSATEVSFAGSGAPLPTDLVTPDQAITSEQAVPGYATSSINSIQLVYNANTKQWYWGMKTDRNIVVSVKASPSQ